MMPALHAWHHLRHCSVAEGLHLELSWNGIPHAQDPVLQGGQYGEDGFWWKVLQVVQQASKYRPGYITHISFLVFNLLHTQDVLRRKRA